ncbi:MAG TPA: tetratricopeptide repeat protein, partial [Longimicrobiales bacterium]|nr:tetratricopeptide repeat protein [Longimicrobiales bacterium]
EHADAAVRGFIENSARGLRSSGRWLLITSLRHQGRLHDALGIIAEERNDTRVGPDFPPFALLMEAIIRYEQGDYVRSAALYDSLVALVPGERSEGSWSRNTVWNMTHAANSHAAAGHLNLLAEMADSARSIGARSGYGRDQRLHHHIRGLLAAARGDYDTAVTEYRAALYSIAGGYSRTNVELARALIATDRPAEAADVLDAPLRNGVLDSMQLYATRTELHALLGEALLEAGQPDRAREHLDAALHALENADASFAGTVAHLRALRERAG